MSHFNLTASRLRLFLAIGLVLLIGIGVTGFVYIQGVLASKASEVSTISTEAAASASTVENLKATESQLTKYEKSGTIQRAIDLVADSTSYHYQDQVILQISALANKAGVSVTAYNFSTASGATSAAATPTKIAGITPTTVNISLKNPVEYSRIMAFISYIEHNLTKMQIARVSLSHDSASGNTPMVNSDSLQVEVYIK
jgi:hypothetical protein